MNLTWKRTLRTASSERFLAQRGGDDVAAVDLHYLANGTIAGTVIILKGSGLPHAHFSALNMPKKGAVTQKIQRDVIPKRLKNRLVFFCFTRIRNIWSLWCHETNKHFTDSLSSNCHCSREHQCY
jgi:hypothetical protein